MCNNYYAVCAILEYAIEHDSEENLLLKEIVRYIICGNHFVTTKESLIPQCEKIYPLTNFIGC